MEVAALCIRLLMTVLLLLIVQVDLSCSQTADEAFPQVVPNRQQHFQYDPIEVSCEGLEGLTGWRVMRKVKEKEVQTCIPDWTKSTGPCKITNAYHTVDSGEYWCEMGGKRSNAVNITVTVGRVILESPALPVMEGKTEALRCRSKMTSSAHIADFYKDGFFIGSGSTGEMTIQHVSKADEGFYKCNISDFGDSAESWLAVRALHRELCLPYVILRTVFTILMVVLLVLLVGLLHFGKLRVTYKYVCICKVCKGKCETYPDNSVKVD